ncbi:tyrosine-type recombinase/integrase [Mucispirillum schaedleri]|jgi:integrase|uniref:Tyrosine recombinase XerD n=1 Tax=Mucispirillum schaedleri ASF457 TaxID=1379858 RepID=V2RK33_9BACT|nr:site-specific integrase [Mucispirillum schaedleri]MCX4360938.1 site-specific integrase [Mucispirillum schaedleri]USF24525.1 Tyrosine recombinase XerD [Mucispirillum schaedleri ASF457]SIW07266.1 conserved hypothetical protein [Mucispirillum schaedleri ASF457]
MTKSEILKQINELTSVLMSDNTDNEKITLERYINDTYIPFQRNSKTERNFRDILGKLKIITSYTFVKKAIFDITENDIVNFFNLLKKDRKITQATQNRYRSCLSHIFNTAIKDKLIKENPVKYIKKYKEESRNRALNEFEVNALLEACKKSKNKELYYIVLAALYTGMRYSNIVNMKKSNIQGNIYQLDGCETKSGKGQLICLHQDLLDELNKYMLEYDNGEYVFKTKEVKRSFKSALKQADIKYFRFHDLRRTFATTLLHNGTNIKVIQHMLGHSSIAMTERYLANDSKKELDASNKLCFINRSSNKA